MFQRTQPNNQDDFLWEDFCTAIKNGDIEKLKTASYPAHFLNKIDDHGSTALHKAAATTHIKVVQFLLKKGASVNTPNNKGATPLHFAVNLGSDGVLEVLLAQQCGADINAQDKRGNTPLHWAAYSKDKLIFEILISHGADATIENKEGEKAAALFKPHQLGY